MEVFKIVTYLFGLLLTASTSSNGQSVSCMIAYDNGGAPAVFDNLECPQLVASARSLQNQTMNCQFAMLQGCRQYQEDRVTCDLDMKIPLLGNNGLKEFPIGIAAVFDGHGGKEASEMASKLFFDYFYLHVAFQTSKAMADHKGMLAESDYMPLNLEILKEALSRTIVDLDSKFTQEAIENDFHSGSTATIVLLFDSKILVASVGDSKALLFSEEFPSGLGAASNLTVAHSYTELTDDHHPNREDEKARITAAGGCVIVWGVPRVNGMLAMSRSIGDVYLKNYGVISEPEITGWRTISANDTHLLVASDGVFESLLPVDISDIIFDWELRLQRSEESNLPYSCLSSSSLAECIVKSAYERGSKDNLSVILVPLR